LDGSNSENSLQGLTFQLETCLPSQFTEPNLKAKLEIQLIYLFYFIFTKSLSIAAVVGSHSPSPKGLKILKNEAKEYPLLHLN